MSLNNVTISGKQSGFTLMEVMIAIVILAASTITLLGVQSAVTRRATLDNQKIRAILAAREILAAAELVASGSTDIDPPDPGELVGTPDSVRNQILGKNPDDAAANRDPPANEKPLEARLTVSEWKIPMFPDPLLFRYELTVSWGNAIGESVTINYFVPIT